MHHLLARRLCLVCMIGVALTSCAGVQRTERSWIPGSGSREACKEGRALLGGKAHIQALAFLAEAYNRFRDKDLLDLYREAARQAKTAGDLAYKRKEYAQAGRFYHVLRQTASGVEELSETLDQEYLETQVRECSRTLAEQGLKEYREENLEAAIELWEQALQFDPENPEIIRAVAAASRQRARVRSMN